MPNSEPNLNTVKFGRERVQPVKPIDGAKALIGTHSQPAWVLSLLFSSPCMHRHSSSSGVYKTCTQGCQILLLKITNYLSKSNSFEIIFQIKNETHQFINKPPNPLFRCCENEKNRKGTKATRMHYKCIKQRSENLMTRARRPSSARTLFSTNWRVKRNFNIANSSHHFW